MLTVRIPNSAESIFPFLETGGARLSKIITHLTPGGDSPVQRGQPLVVLGILTSSWNQTAQVRHIMPSGQVLLTRSQKLCLVLLFAWCKQHILVFFLCINYVLSGQTGGYTESRRRSKIMSLDCHRNWVKTRKEMTGSPWGGDSFEKAEILQDFRNTGSEEWRPSQGCGYMYVCS